MRLRAFPTSLFRMNRILACAWLLIACTGTGRQPTQNAAAHAGPPVAPRHPKKIEQHGETRIDEYAWLREKDSPEVIAYLQAENAYTDEVMRPTEALQRTLYDGDRRAHPADRRDPAGPARRVPVLLAHDRGPAVPRATAASRAALTRRSKCCST